MRIPSVHDLFWAHRGLLSDKWEQYIPVYEAEFHAHLEQGAPVTLLEIGVQNGGSLEIWHKLLPPSSRIVGLDIDERCRDLKLSEGIELHIGDATKKDFINLALGETRFDFIIDDGSHRPEHVIASFELLFERLKPGGIYVVEDLHCSYWSAYNGGFRDPRSAIEWAKNLVDGLNADHIESPSELHGRELARLKAFNTEIARIAFFDSMLVVQKYPAAKLRPFARVFAGSQAPIADPVDWLFRVPTSDLKNWMAAPPVATRMNAELVRRYEEKELELKRINDRAEALREETELLRAMVRNGDTRIADLQEALARENVSLPPVNGSTARHSTASLGWARSSLRLLGERVVGRVRPKSCS